MMCARDLLFYVNTFVWTYDPRRDPPTVPMITWPFQDRALLELQAAIGDHDLGIEKSRDMGASWLCLVAMEHAWHFQDYRSFLLVSRKASLVDSPGDPKCLFWKIEFIHEWQPDWLRPRLNQERDRKAMHMFNPDTNSTFNGEYTTGDVARGDRRTAILLDEFAFMDNAELVDAATADATSCRLINSTHSGTGHLFYQIREKIKFLRLHWSEHPEKAKGLYFKDGKARSPWYDAECRRRGHPQLVAQELDIDPVGANFPLFGSAILEKHKEKHGRPPSATGELVFDPDTLEPKYFEERDNGRLRLWANPGGDGRLPGGREYVVACDVSQGTGASNSTMSVADRRTGEKVAEFCFPGPDYPPSAHAQYAVALCRWMGASRPEVPGAYLIWEANGPGHLFWGEVKRLGYANYYYHENEKVPYREATKNPGYYTTKIQHLLEPYRDALRDEQFINHSHEAIQECQHFIYVQGTNKVEHTGAASFDPSGARENHGDRVVADALAWHVVKQSVGLPPPAALPEVPPGCLAERMQLAAKERAAKKWW